MVFHNSTQRPRQRKTDVQKVAPATSVCFQQAWLLLEEPPRIMFNGSGPTGAHDGEEQTLSNASQSQVCPLEQL